MSNTVIPPLTLLSPPLSNKPSPSNKPPPLFRERKLMSPPPLPLLFFTNKWETVSINYDCKTSCGLTWDGLVRIGFWSSAVWPNTFCTSAFPLCIRVLCGELILSSFLNWISPPLSNKPPVSFKLPPQMGLKEISPPPPLGGLFLLLK